MVVLAAITGLAGLSLLCAAANALFLGRFALRSRRQARRVGAGALALLCLALTVESLVFGALALLRGEDFVDGPLSRAALLAVRTLLFAATALISLLVWRQGAGRG